MLFTERKKLSTGCHSPPRPPSRRLPSVASGLQHNDYYYYDGFSPVGYTLTEPHFGPQNWVHLSNRV